MRWSIKLGRLAGIDVYMHATFLLLLGWIGLSYWFETGSIASTVSGVFFILALFACVVLHEYGHALTARRFGIGTRDITLLPIGGLARLERIPRDPTQELLVALAGPAVNVVIAGVLYAYMAAVGSTQTLLDLQNMDVTSGSMIARLFVINVALVLFNLLPAFPMDGGRVLRALLAMRMSYARATQSAANIGQLMALLFGFVGLFTNPFLLFIAFFVWIGAGQEAGMVQMQSALGDVSVERVMLTDFRALSPSDSLSEAAALTIAGTQADFPVVEGERIVGILTQSALLRGLQTLGADSPISETMARDFCTAQAQEMTEKVLSRIQDAECHTVAVTRDGRLIGMVTMENIGEFLRMRAALGDRAAAAVV